MKRRDALCSLVEAVKQTSHLNSFVELSLAPTFRHRWHSIYAITDAEIDTERLNLLCLAQVPCFGSSRYNLGAYRASRIEENHRSLRCAGYLVAALFAGLFADWVDVVKVKAYLKKAKARTHEELGTESKMLWNSNTQRLP